MRRAARTDTNHANVTAALTAIGAFVLDIHAVPGALDLLVAYRGALTLLEIKDGQKTESRLKATAAERATLREALHRQAPAWIVWSEHEAMVMVGAIDDAAARERVIDRTHEEASFHGV